MSRVILGKKIGMTQVFDKNGNVTPVTAIEAGPCEVIQVKNEQHDGYNALKVGFGNKNEKKTNKPLKGEFKKAGVKPKKYLREIRVDKFDKEHRPGDTISINVFKPGDKIKVTGYSKGKGFSGVIKRYNFHRGPMTHGSHNLRSPGSVGMCATPSKVLKGKRMPGRVGNKKVTIPYGEVVDVVEDRNLILVKGGVPGSKGNLVVLKKIEK